MIALDHFGVSESMLNWRLNVTGARIRVQRAKPRSRTALNRQDGFTVTVRAEHQGSTES